jgi:soluble lytic murein transglycosylase-like protein
VALVPATSRAGGIYRYVEKDGTVVYTNVKPTTASNVKVLRGRSFHPAPGLDLPSEPVARERVTEKEYNQYIQVAARKYRIPHPLVWAVMHTESNFDPDAVSPVGASGLMQLMPATAREMYVKDIFDVRENIEGGTRYLRVLANLFEGDMVKMIAAYNAGPEAVRKYNGQVPPYPETQAYVRRVLTLYFKYRQQKVAQSESP